jgi:hypothetical protein
VLVCAPSNSALDEIVLRVLQSGFSFVSLEQLFLNALITRLINISLQKY